MLHVFYRSILLSKLRNKYFVLSTRRTLGLWVLCCAFFFSALSGCAPKKGSEEETTAVVGSQVLCEIREEFVLPMTLVQWEKRLPAVKRRCARLSKAPLEQRLETLKEGIVAITVYSNGEVLLDAVVVEDKGHVNVRETVLDYPFSECFWNSKENGWPFGPPETADGAATPDSPYTQDIPG